MFVPEENWMPTHPNYLHTDAMLEYYKAISGFGGDLEHALRQINKALEVVPTRESYVDLLHDIINAQNRLK